VLIALLGYGVALSVEARFGMPHSAIFNSTSDLLVLGGWAVIHMLSNLDRFSEWDFYATMWTKFWPMQKIALIGASLAALIGAGAAAGRHLISRWNWAKTLRAEVGSFVSRHARTARMIAFAMIVGVGILAVWPLTALVAVFSIVVLGLALSIVPMFGHLAGIGHIDDWVIAPKICTPLRSDEFRVAGTAPQSSTATGGVRPRSASCVAIRKDDGKEFRGRVVFATFDAVLLYEPQTGTIRRISTAGAAMEVIGEL
jgi:hypothetical protein